MFLLLKHTYFSKEPAYPPNEQAALSGLPPCHRTDVQNQPESESEPPGLVPAFLSAQSILSQTESLTTSFHDFLLTPYTNHSTISIGRGHQGKALVPALKKQIVQSTKQKSGREEIAHGQCYNKVREGARGSQREGGTSLSERVREGFTEVASEVDLKR